VSGRTSNTGLQTHPWHWALALNAAKFDAPFDAANPQMGTVTAVQSPTRMKLEDLPCLKQSGMTL
jgi:hypothetical protein